MKHKMDKDRAEILREMKMHGGLRVGSFGEGYGKEWQGVSKLRDDRGAVETDEAAMTALARSHVESLGKGDGWIAVGIVWIKGTVGMLQRSWMVQ